jgi:isocitrate dehydrogenase
LADTPEAFDVLVMPNLYGDILSDVAAQIAGSVGLAGSANIGDQCAMFEAIHGSAPRRAGQNLANPSGLLLAAVMMLVHIDQPEVATKVHNAWLRTMEDGVHTYDIFVEGVSKQKVGTKEFADAVVARLGQQPQTLKTVQYISTPKQVTRHTTREQIRAKKELFGVDVFLDWSQGTPDQLGAALQNTQGEGLELTLIANRGARVWPNGLPETFTTDHWRCRFLAKDVISHTQITSLLQRVADSGFDFIKTENLYNFDGQAGYSSVSGA